MRVRDDVDSAQMAKTLAHELAHVQLHDGTECRGRCEVEAESVAYLVCEAAGLTTTAYSFPYVARWPKQPTSSTTPPPESSTPPAPSSQRAASSPLAGGA